MGDMPPDPQLERSDLFEVAIGDMAPQLERCHVFEVALMDVALVLSQPGM